jgi:putative transcriptional regulator
MKLKKSSGFSIVSTCLKGQFLVATPGTTDPRFDESVVYLVGHGEDGAMGLVINQLLPEMRFTDILEEMELGPREDLIKLPTDVQDMNVLRGGPVEKGRGFVLHSTDYFREDNSYRVNEDVCLTATTDVLRAISFGPAPENSLFALGYCGWSPGQLEQELKDNGWLTSDHSDELLFKVPVDERYDRALTEIGVTRASLNPQSGNA